MMMILRNPAASLICGMLIALGVSNVAPAQESKSPSGPWALESLRRPPSVEIIEEKNSVTSLTYDGEPYQGKPTRVFAYLARPDKVGGKLPAMVLVHGGGGTAFKEWAELWAKRGYIALAMDLTGREANRKRMPDGGPPQQDAAIFGDVPVTDAWSYHAVADVVRGVSLLAHRAEVDPERIGITGISWGGYLTCIVAGLDDRLKVAVPVYGCGFLDENSVWRPTFLKMRADHRNRWAKNFDPSRYLPNAKMPMLFVNGTNDFAYPMDSYQKSYRLVKDRNLSVTVNMPHGHPQGWAPVEIGLFVDQHLRGGKPLPTVTQTERKGDKVEASYRSESPVVAAALHFTTDNGPWQKRKWQTRPAKFDKNRVAAELPPERPLVYFLTLTDDRKATISTEHQILDEKEPSDAKETPNPLPENIIKAWKSSGAIAGWMKVEESGLLSFVDEFEAGATPAFRFTQWKDGVVAKLPVPDVPFGLYLSKTEVTDAGLKELANLKDLRLLCLCETAVTAEAVEALRRVLPNCIIFHC